MINTLTRYKNIHFIGIGGIGMSSIASILLERGFGVSGSDIKPNRLTLKIMAKGGKIFAGHKSSNLPKGTELVVYSSSIDEKNPEIIKARKNGIPVLHRSDVVAELVNPNTGVAVTGAHGKTTTTALCALVLTMAGFDPTVIVGGEVDFLGANYRNGSGNFVVCEADESDGTFLKLKPSYAVLTNIDREHLDYYKTLKAIIRANRDFIANIKEWGCLIASYDDENIRVILKDCKKRVLTYGSKRGADIYSRSIKMDGFNTSFEAVHKGRNLGLFELNVPGAHNVENALAAILLGMEMKVDPQAIRRALVNYRGTARRFQVKGIVNDIVVIEDYAHHPREIMATIAACRNWPGRRLVGVFQPHRYSRTKFLKEEFAKSFLGLDELILTDIYSASEKPIPGVSTRSIYKEAVKKGQRNVRLFEKGKILPHLLRTLNRDDVVLILGAGDIGEISDELVKKLKHKG